jgi:hypothetical protein
MFPTLRPIPQSTVLPGPAVAQNNALPHPARRRIEPGRSPFQSTSVQALARAVLRPPEAVQHSPAAHCAQPNVSCDMADPPAQHPAFVTATESRNAVAEPSLWQLMALRLRRSVQGAPPPLPPPTWLSCIAGLRYDPTFQGVSLALLVTAVSVATPIAGAAAAVPMIPWLAAALVGPGAVRFAKTHVGQISAGVLCGTLAGIAALPFAASTGFVAPVVAGAAVLGLAVGVCAVRYFRQMLAAIAVGGISYNRLGAGVGASAGAVGTFLAANALWIGVGAGAAALILLLRDCFFRTA